jgi:hypothetical protein
MSNFDLRKFLAEGKLYEEATSTEEAMDKPSTKMKMSELKKKIREEILSELELNEDSTVDLNVSDPNDEYSFVYEATKDGDGEVPSKDADTDIDIEDKEEVEVDVEKKPKATGADDEFLDQLETLQDEAEEIGDNKLERQIANTITYFTRQHIAKDTNESLELEEAYDELEENDMDLVADLEAELKEGYSEFQRADKGKKKTVARNKGEEEVYGAGVKKGEEIEKAKVNEAQEDEVPLTSKVKSFINKAISDAKKDGKFEDLKKADWFENELIDMLIELFEDKDYDRASKEVKDYIKTKTTMKESLEILRMKKLAGLITEGEYTKALLKENQVNNKYVVKDEELSDKDYTYYDIDTQKAFNYLKQFNNSDVNAKQYMLDDEGWGEFRQYLDNVEQMSDEELEDAMRQEMSYYFFSKPDEI